MRTFAMRVPLWCNALVVAGLLGFAALGSQVVGASGNEQDAEDGTEDSAEPMFVHNVFFSLKDNSAASKQKLLEACKKYLTAHEGEVFFAVGVLCDERMLRANDRDFDVDLLIVFKRQADIAIFDKSARHVQFAAENKANWKKVRVFDALARR
ncbi:MAG TPA: Dabb family protein [Pirellulales bacterium]|jgi:hypothetical protein|nr:Dabb family protein [Pirellulales bacterium]